MPNRFCAACGRSLSKECYSKNQWSKGDGVSRCAGCVHQNGNGTEQAKTVVDPAQTARCNNSTRASFANDALDHPFASGSFRWVAKGVYTAGNRAGQTCVCKWFKTGSVMEKHFYDADIAAANEAVRLLTKRNSKGLINRMVKINLPEVWAFDPQSGIRSGRKVLQEPFIENYQKFNSNTGWSDDTTPWPRVMQALSHFTYHVSNAQTLLCDLQGGVYNDGVVLTDPVIMSVSRGYGPTHHKCNEFCRSEWRKPHNPIPYYSRTAGTTMEHVPTRNSRQPMSHARHYY